MMKKNIVICADGTGSSFGKRMTNVARIVKLLCLHDHSRQVVIYDQGIGTDGRRWKEIERFRRSIPDPEALRVLRGPHESWFPPAEYLAVLRGLAYGEGLEKNVKQMYGELAQLWNPGDLIYLFGFSRGAFTVRALAGLLYRCGLPERGRVDFDRLFERAWQIFEPMRPCQDQVNEFRAVEKQRDCAIHFMGLWDTVKSYGGLYPKMLPHLRHNPIVMHVRHALALDERRGWFDTTTWGGLDLDRQEDGAGNYVGAWSRLPEDVRRGVERQVIQEVWFRGCHSDVGGGSKGDEDGRNARVALRWILVEAAAEGLCLNTDGRDLCKPLMEPDCPKVRESQNLFWRVIELKSRKTIDNSHRWPERKGTRGDAKRHPFELTRDRYISVHESVRPFFAQCNVRTVRTRTLASEE